MRIGVIVPNGWTGEYDGWEPATAWQRTVAVAKQAEALGFDAIWTWDHFHRTLIETTPDGRRLGTLPTTVDEMTFESFTTLSALAMVTSRVQLGQVVSCNGFRNPALLAKEVAMLDLISGGRAILGIGAGWKQEEWEAYGYGFPDLRTRLAMLKDGLEIVTRMLAPDRERAWYEGDHASVRGAINLPRPLQEPRPTIMVGGNGQNVTWRLAARYADELNTDGMDPGTLAGKMPVIRQRCEEIGRDPASLAVSAHIFWSDLAAEGRQRVDLLAAYRELGLARVMGLLQASASSDEALERLAEDALAAGCELAPATG